MSSSASERSLISSAGMLTAAQYAGAGVGFVTTIVAARLLGAESFGVAAVVMAYPSVVSSFAGVKTSSVTQRYVSGFRATHQHRELLAVCKLGFAIDFVQLTLVTLVILLTISLFGDLPGAKGHGDLVALFALSLPLSSFASTAFVVLSAFRRFGLIAVVELGQKLAILITVSAALLAGGGTAAFVVINAGWMAATGLIWLVLASVLLERAAGDHWWTAPLWPIRALLGELRSLLGWNFLGTTVSGALTQVPVLLLGALSSTTDAGYFRLASSVAVTADSVEASMNRVAYPTLAAARAVGDTHKIARLVVEWSRREARLAVSAVLVAMAGLPLVVLALGREYLGMLLGAELMLVGTATSAAFFYLTPYLYSDGQVKRWVVWNGIYVFAVVGTGSLLADAGGFSVLAALVGGGQAVINLALGLPILRRARQSTAMPSPGGEVSISDLTGRTLRPR